MRQTLPLLAVLALIATACTDSSPVAPLNVRPNAVVFPGDGGGDPGCTEDPGTATVVVTADPVPSGSSVDVTADFDGVPSEASIDWGDGSEPTAGTVSDDGVVSGSHVYATAGVFTVSVTATGCTGDAVVVSATNFVVVYNAAGGFVTGGGWIDSPAGAYAADPAADGKATFGFVAKLKKGDVVPTGNTEFQLHSVKMNFKSKSYDWMAASTTQITFRGLGTVNGVEGFGFAVTAVDGRPIAAEDAFRIRIWNVESGEVVYDSQVTGNTADNATPTTELANGSIVIHK